MPVVHLSDEGGAGLRCLDVDGYIVPTFNITPNHEQEYRSIPDWQARDDDIMICAYPKSGTHWVWEAVCMLIQGSAERIDGIKEEVMLEGLSKSNFDKIKSPRILNSHILFKYLPRDFLKRQCKIIYMVRNPKDICVSFFNHHTRILEYEFEGTWENYVPRYLKGDVDYGSWFDYTLDWEQVQRENPEYPIHVVFFETMKQKQERVNDLKNGLSRIIAKSITNLTISGFIGDVHLVNHDKVFNQALTCSLPQVTRHPLALQQKQNYMDSLNEIRRLAKFLEVELDDSVLKQIDDMCHFDKMKKEKNKHENPEEWKDKQPGMYRKGQVGDWKNWFTVAQNELFDSVYDKQMRDSKIFVEFT